MAPFLSPEHKELMELEEWLDANVAGDASQEEWDKTVARCRELRPIVAAQRKIAQEDAR